MAKIRKDDLVEVISGGDKGKQGKVLEVLVAQQRVIVEGVNYVTKHVREGQTQRGTKTGGRETVEAPIHVSNVALVDPETGRGTRTGVKEEEVEKDGVTKTVRTRVFKTTRRAAKPAEKKTTKKAATKKAAAKDSE
ncbi:50S ribosomal protein L24 [Gulosibacter molinativorax]|uniref:Large ribosomal subunit protein uL24 n=1 Tax=Gulosibacter molinativorax TaxID=256821 RepID=A0ABT7C4H0_9MICO|nr:50S ribosomal protein L24 [Gulosibacter molinativorax]QUY63706.1 50S ribosomal protein L24 [Gulosibacter molinativorax]